MSRKSMTYGEIADMINSWLEGLVPIGGPLWTILKGQELFQQSKVDKIMEQAVYFLLGEAPEPEPEAKWVAILRTRLTFARDWFLAKHQHSVGKEEKIKGADVPRMLKKAVTDEWHIQGLEWLLLYRAGIPIMRGCPDWKLCESARWAMLENGENASMGYEPGVITQDEPIYTLEKIQSLVSELYSRVSVSGLPEETQGFYIEDASSAWEPENTEEFALLMSLLMKDADFAVHSVPRILRLSKRLSFAADYLSTLEPSRPVTRREAFATIAVTCSIVWAVYAKDWLCNPQEALKLSFKEKYAPRPSFVLFEHRHIICDILEAPHYLAYFGRFAT